MKVGDLVRCLETQERGTIISSRSRFGGEIWISAFDFGVEWFGDDCSNPHWNSPNSLEVITFSNKE